MGATVEHDPEWLPEDHLAAIEWQGEQDLLCPGGCGKPRDETMMDEDDPHRPQYTAEAIVCHACAARSRGAHHDTEEAGPEPLHGWLWGVRQSLNGRGYSIDAV